MKRKTGYTILVVIIFLILTVIMTYPLVFKINTHIPAFFSTDESFAVLWNSWFIKFSLAHHLSIRSTDLIAHPFSVDFYTNKPVIYLWFLINYSLSILTNPVLTYNLQVIFNLLLAATFNYLLVYYLTGNRFAAFFAGTIFGFCPYIFVRSWQHLGETYLWIMPMALLYLFRLRQNPSRATKLLFIISLIFTTIGANFYYLGVAFITFLVYLFIYTMKNKTLCLDENKKYFKNIILFSCIVFILLIPQNYPIIKGIITSRKTIPAAQNIYYRPFKDLFEQSAKSLSYFLPAVVHPFFGKFTEMFIGSQLYGMSFTEHTLYLGWAPLILAFVAFKRWRRRRKEVKIGTVPFGDSPYFYIGFFVSLAIVAWFFSQPPWWKFGPLKIYMPSFFMYKILPVFRAYCRFGIVVMLAVSVLAGFGLKFILDRFNSKKKRIAITTLFCVLVLFEFWNYPPFKVIDVSRVPQVYYWLKEQRGDFAIAEYPLDIVGPSEIYRLYQTKHEKKIINATIPGTPAHRLTKTLTELSNPNTAGVLKWMGVKYILVHKEDYLNTGLIDDSEELNKIPQNPGLKFIKTFPSQECPQKDILCIQKTGPVDVYEVVASPIKPKIE